MRRANLPNDLEWERGSHPPAIAQIAVSPSSPTEILRRRSPKDLERLLDLAVQNQNAEGYVLTPEEIAEVRRRLRKLAFGDE